ncbi:TipJ family phage tail tip protein [Ponticoccus litoralis]|uniref:Fibronectin type-III domain-containing protein n=1 Tax=Ponticoccus litoralis TaxID=422297 RepID=A0AAW9SN81_9RHOB
MTVTRASATYQVPAAGWRQGSEVMRLYSDDVAEDAYSDVPQENDPVIKYTRQETVSAAVDLTFPQGLYNSTFDGDLSSHRARFRFEYQRTEGGLNEADWVDLGETEWSGKYVSLYRVTKEIAFPAPDEYAIRITRTNGIDQDVGDVNSATLTAIRSIRDGKLPSHAGIAEVAFRIRANEQLNGRIDSLNAIVQQLAPELDSNLQWTEPRPVRHPAWLYAQALRGPHLRRPVTDDRIDLAALHAWATEEPHWTCDYVVDTATQLADVLDIICAAGRGRRTLADLRYSVVRDGAAGPVRQVFTPRNSWDYRSKLTFPREIHGFRCMVRSERLDWQEDEVLVLKDGYTRQTATELETLQLPGTVVTAEDADEGNTYRLGRYHLATALHRPETHSFKADWESIHIQQGDKIRLVHDVPLIGVGEARVKALTVENDLIISITLDDVFDLDQASFRMVVRNVSAGIHAFAATSPVDPQARVWTPTVGVIAGDVAVGDLVAIEETEQRSADMLVMAVRPDQDETALIEVVDAAPHVLDAASDIPPYDPVITNPRPPASDLPPAPVITAARSSQLTQIVLPDLSVRPRIAVQLAPIASRADLDGVTVQLRWREAGEDETPRTYGESVPAGEYSLLTGALEEGVRYLVEARTVGRAGKTRGWFAAPMQVTATTAAPAPPPIVASAVPASIPDANGSARRPAIRLSRVAPANRTLRVTWRLRVAGASEIGQRGLFAEASEGEVLIADGILPNTAYQIQASFVSGAADLRSWGGWMDVATPDIRLTVDDLDEDALSGGFDYPTAPANLALSTHLREDGAAVVNATWDAADPATGYEIEVAENGGGYVGTSSTTNAYALTVLPGTSLQIRVRAVNGPRRSDWVGPEAITAAVDTIPPAAPSGLTAEAGFGTVWLSWNANTEPDMAFYEIVEKANANAPAPNTTSPILTSTAATFARTGLNDDVTKYYWVRAVDTSGNRSSWSSMASATTPAPAGIDTEDLQGLIDETSFAAGLEGVRVVSGSTLPTTRSTSAIVFGGDLYRWNGTAYVKSVQAVDISGQVTGAQIADQALGTAKFANSIKPVEVLSALPGTPHVKGRQVFLTTNNKLYRNTGSGWIASVAAGDVTGKLTNAQIEALEAAKLTGQITGTQISDGAVSTPKLEANSVTTDKLLVTGRGSALNDDPNTSDASAWSAGDIVHPASPAVGPTALRSTKAYSFSRQFQVDESKQYRVRCVARPSSNANGDFFLRLYHYDANGNQISYNTVAHRPSFSGGWQVFDAIIDVPAGTVTASLNVILNHAGTQGYHEAQDVRCEEAVDSARHGRWRRHRPAHQDRRGEDGPP